MSAPTEARSADATPIAFALYALVLLGPVATLAVSAVAHRNVALSVAFVTLLGMLLLVRTWFHSLQNALTAAAANKAAPDVSTSVNLLKSAARLAFAAAVAIWWIFAHTVSAATGVIGTGSRERARRRSAPTPVASVV